MGDFRECEEAIHPERCCLCDGLVVRGDVFRELPAKDEDGPDFMAAQHRRCVEEDERLGVSIYLDAEERWGCMADLGALEDCMGEAPSAEYLAFRAEVDARGGQGPWDHQACRACGCTEHDCSGCIERTGHPCWWVEDDLCSACEGGNDTPGAAGEDA